MDQKYLSEIKDRIKIGHETDGHAYRDIPALAAEVERLTAENQGLRANSMIQEHIISGGRDPARDDKIVRLIMDNTAKDQQIATLKEELHAGVETANMWTDAYDKGQEENATLKKAYETACEFLSRCESALNNEPVRADRGTRLQEHFIQQLTHGVEK